MTKEVGDFIDSGEHLVVRWRNQKTSFRTMSESEARALIEAGRLGRLGCVDGREPYVVPFNYFFEEGSIFGHSLPGKKIHALRAHPRACVQIDEVQDDFHWRSVLAFGNFEEIKDEAERRRAMRKLFKHCPLLTPVDSFVISDALPPEVVVFRICIDRLTGVVSV
jgi:nitroimidazol reductase NimA-like FMN-containing flavoprotein (pyridoxamine 5'-phosphate oxidase superfamily)